MINKILWRRVTVGRAALHAMFWLAVFVAFTAIYAFKSNHLVAARNNLFYVPVYMGYFYGVAYWVIPKYLFKGRYLMAAIFALLFMLITTTICRAIDIWFTIPYLAAKMHLHLLTFPKVFGHPFGNRFLNPVPFVIAFKC